MQYTIRHETRCHFDSPASYSIRQLRITPREEAGVRVAQWQVNTPVHSSRSVDAWGNTTHLLTLTEPHENVRIVVTGVVDVPDSSPALIGLEQSPLAPQIYLASTQLTTPGAALAALAHKHLSQPPQDIDDVLTLLQALREQLLPAPSGGEAVRGAESSFTPPRRLPLDRPAGALRERLPARRARWRVRLGRCMAGAGRRLGQFRCTPRPARQRSPDPSGGGPRLSRRLPDACSSPRWRP
jgi:transglutaminase-like putative cysteine protease